MAATHVGNSATRAQLRIHLERGNPRADQMRGIAGPEETHGPGEKLRIVLVPADAIATFESVRSPVHGTRGRKGHLKRTWQESWAVFVGEGEGLLFRQAEAIDSGHT